MSVNDVALGLEIKVALVAVHLDEGPGLGGRRPWRKIFLGEVARRAGLLEAGHVVDVDGGHHHRHVQRVPVEPAVLVARVQVVQHKLCAWELISLGSVEVQYEEDIEVSD